MDIQRYHSILCDEFPQFLKKYLSLPILTRLKKIGLLCGTDYTRLYSNRMFYSRFDHSVGCALIAWNFTRDKKQALASLLHDVSTPVFSHAGDFRKGDALTQSATEDANAKIILENGELAAFLKEDGLKASDVCDYHIYPVCDNEIPQLSSDRLEYMFPSGYALCDYAVKDTPCFELESAERCYRNIRVLKNENGVEELGFTDLETALEYTKRFCDVALILQRNENKLALNMLGAIVNEAVETGVLEEEDLYELGEVEVFEKLEKFSKPGSHLRQMVYTFKNMESIEHLNENPGEGYYSVCLDVKKRYINPLVLCSDGIARRVWDLSQKGRIIIENFLNFKDTPWGSVRLLSPLEKL